MICRTCLRRAAGLASRQLNLSSTTTLSQTLAAPFSTTTLRTFSTSLPILNTSSASAEAQPAAAQGAPDLNPVTPGAAAAAAEGEGKKPLSSCPAGTVLKGLNYFKGKNDPVALPDEAYPEWLWRCLEVKKKTNEGEEGVDVGDEFSKSKKQRRLALKRLRAQEAKLLASGDLEALAPKIPLQQQSINLPGAETGSLQEAVAAVDAREALRRAMRKERRAKIKESNYLKAM